MDLSAWLRADKIALQPGDGILLEQLAADLLVVVAADHENPRSYEVAAACELAIAQYFALAGDWTIAEAVKSAKKQDAVTKTAVHGQVAEARVVAKAAFGRIVADVVVRTRAIRNLADGKVIRAGKVVPFPGKRTGT